jgi:uncharacterized repeat protein (TIGR01451 family)
MISQMHPALIRSSRLLLRSIVITLVLLSLLTIHSGYNRAQDAAWAEESTPTTPSELTATLSTFPLSFIANAGQTDSQVRFHVRGMSSDLLFAPHEVALVLPTSGEERAYKTLHMSFVGANPHPTITGADLLPGVVNYLYGNDPDRWITNVPTYAAIIYEQLYPGINLRYDGTEGVLKGTYLITPGVDPNLIRWQYDGVSQMQIDPATQNLLLYLSDSDEEPALIELAPVAWQNIGNERVPVKIEYALFEDNSIGFTLGSYDPAYALYLDPTLQFCTYLGGPAIDEGLGIAVDSSANVYVTGRTNSTLFPAPVSPPFPPFQPNLAGLDDAFVAKISMSTKQLVYRTYLGGPAFDVAYGIVVDSGGNAYITGETQSEYFPILGDVHQPTYAGGTDAFVTVLNASGSALIYSTFLGGLGLDRGQGIAVDGSGQAYVTGETNSSPLSFGTFNTLPGGGTYGGGAADAFVTKFTSNGTDVLLSTFLGGNDIDRGQDIAVSSSGVVYVTGRTDSSVGFPLVSANQSTYGTAGDAFVASFTTTGTPAYIYSTYLGGNGLDEAKSIVIDSSGKAYVTGETGSSNFPQQGALPAGQGGTDKGGVDAFVTAYNSSGERVYSTYLGGSNDDKGEGIGLDSSGNIYVAGQTQSADFPYLDGFQETGFGGLSDAFITKIVAAGTSLEYSSYIGGAATDQAFDLAVAGGGSAYLTGDTNSEPTSFPATPGSFQRGGLVDAFVIRIGSTAADVRIEKIDDIPTVAVGEDLPYTITVRNNGPDSTVVLMTDKLSSYVDFVSAAPEPANPKVSCVYTDGNRTVACDMGEMLSGEVIVIKLKVNVKAMPPTSNVSNTASVASTEFDPVETNNSYTQFTVVYAQADLEVTKLADSYRVKQDKPVQFSVSIKNLGPGIGTGVSLKDVLPPELTFVSAVPPGSTTYNAGTGLWTVGTIQPGTTVTLTINATVKATTPIGTIITNTANNLVSTVEDPEPGNNSSTIQLRVVTEYPVPGCHPSPVTSGEVICLSG